MSRWLLLVLSFASAACGGSSSETPFPLEPDRATLRAPVAAAPAGSGTLFDPSDGSEEDIVEPDAPAAPTWGAAGKKRKPRKPVDAP